MVVNPKAKGGEFERKICVELSKWITKGEKIDCFWRSAMSGGRATVKRGQVRQSGDITAVAPEGHILTDRLFIECKHLKQISFDSLIKGNGPLLVIWKKAVQEAFSHNKFPVLIFRQNHWPTVFCASIQAVAYLELPQSLILIKSGGMCAMRFDSLMKTEFKL